MGEKKSPLGINGLNDKVYFSCFYLFYFICLFIYLFIGGGADLIIA